MRLKFHGTCGSFPLRNRRGTALNSQQSSCIELFVEKEGSVLYFDAGSGLNDSLCQYFSQSKALREIHLLLSHTHWDHIAGLASLYPWLKDDVKVFIYSGFADIKERIEGFFDNKYWPVPFDLYAKHVSTQHLPAEEVHELLGLKIKLKRHHHPGGCFSYSVSEKEKKVLYCTDIEFIESEGGRYEDPYYHSHDLVIFDTHLGARNLKEGAKFGHSSMRDAVKFAQLTNSKKVCFTHHDPLASADEIITPFEALKEELGNSTISLELAQDSLELNF